MPNNQARPLQVEYRDFYIYTVPILAIAPAGTASFNVNIQAHYSFLLQKLTYFADIAAAAQTYSTRIVPLITVQITDTGSGTQLFSQPAPIPALCGTGEIPFLLQTPRLFEANTVVTLAFTNYDAAVTYNLYLLMIGTRIWSTK